MEKPIKTVKIKCDLIKERVVTVWEFPEHFMMKYSIESKVLDKECSYGFRVNKKFTDDNYLEAKNKLEKIVEKEWNMNKEFTIRYMYSKDCFYVENDISFEELIEEFVFKKEDYHSFELFFKNNSKSFFSIMFYRPELTMKKRIILTDDADKLSKKQLATIARNIKTFLN